MTRVVTAQSIRAASSIFAIAARRIVVLLWLLPGCWYLYALAFYPQPLLWLLAGSAFLLLTMLGTLWPRSCLVWLPPFILIINITSRWLPWPGVKAVYLAPAAVCAAFALRYTMRRKVVRLQVGPASLYVLACCAMMLLFSVIARYMPAEPAALRSLWQEVRIAPLVSQLDTYPGLRYAWVWGLAWGLAVALRSLLRSRSDVRLLFWSCQICSLAVAAFGIYSFKTTKFMVDYYVYDQRINATLSSPAVLADAMTVVFICGMYLMFTVRRWWLRLLLLFPLAAQLTCITLSGCRVNFVALVVLAIGWLFWIMWRRPLRTQLLSMAIAAAAVIAILLALHMMPDTTWRRVPIMRRALEWRGAWQSWDNIRNRLFIGRWRHWQCAWRMWRSAPLWGVGIGHFEQLYSTYRMPGDLFPSARAHNVLLRIGAEGGLMTLSAVVLLIGCGMCRAVYAWLVPRSFHDDWAGVVRTAASALGALCLIALSSDVLFENTEIAMLTMVLIACAWAGCVRCGIPARVRDANTNILNAVNTRLQRWMIRRDWGSWPHFRIQPLFILAISATLLIVIARGWYNARVLRNNVLREGQLSYGWHSVSLPPVSGQRWFSIDQHAMIMVQPRSSLMVIHCRATNARTARANKTLDFYLNGLWLATVPLSETITRTIYCDISGLTDPWHMLTVRARRSFVPWTEGWYADPYPTSALVTQPYWLSSEPSNTIAVVDGIWNVRWSAYRDFYHRAGYTNRWVIY